MENCVELKVPNKVDYEVGDNWGDISDEPDDMFQKKCINNEWLT